MSNPFTDSFNAIDAEIANAVQASNVQKEIEVRGAKAAKHLLMFQFKQAAAELGIVADLVGKKGQTANAATAKFAQARAFAQMDNGLDDALKTANQAADTAGKVDDMNLRGDIALFIGKLQSIQENFIEAYQSFSFAVSIFSLHATNPEKFIEALRLRAGVGVFVLLFDQVIRDLESALELAQQANLTDIAAEIELQLAAVEVFAGGELTSEGLGQLLNIGSQLGDQQFGMEPNLIKALEKLQQKKLAAAKNLAQKSLDLARPDDSASGYVRYLTASFVLAEIHDAADEKIEVLKVMLRCKVYVEQKFAPAAGTFINEYLNSFQKRWGAETLQQTIRDYQAWVSENGPVQA